MNLLSNLPSAGPPLCLCLPLSFNSTPERLLSFAGALAIELRGSRARPHADGQTNGRWYVHDSEHESVVHEIVQEAVMM